MLNRIVVVGCLVFMTACSSDVFRIKDDGRLRVANEATTLADELAVEGVFAPLEERDDALSNAYAKTVEEALKFQQETFMVVAASRTAGQVEVDLIQDMVKWLTSMGEFAATEESAKQNVLMAINRQSLVTAALAASLPKQIQALETKRDAEPDDAKRQALQAQIDALTRFSYLEGNLNPSISELYERVKRRLSWIDKRTDEVLKTIDEVGDKVPETDTGATVGALLEEGSESATSFKTWLDALKKGVEEVEKDDQVVAARALLKSMIKEQLDAERERVAEYRRHLGAVMALRGTVNRRAKVTACEVHLNAFIRLWPASFSDALYATYENLVSDYGSRYDCLPSFKNVADARTEFEGTPDHQSWIAAGELSGSEDPTLTHYVAANLEEAESPMGAQLLSAIAILQFVEGPFVDAAEIKLLEEVNRHGLRLLKISANQRLALIRDMAGSLEIYEQGGFTPEEVSEALLFLGHIGALTFIGTQQ